MKQSFVICLVLAGCHGASPGGDPADEAGGDTSSDTAGPVYEIDTAAAEEVWTVCPEGDADWPALQPAVDAATDGVVLALCAGTWTEPVVVEGHAVTIRGADGAASTVLDGGGTGTPVTVRGDGSKLTLEDVTVRGGSATTSYGGGVSCTSATLAVVRSVVTDSTASEGGGIGAVDCSVLIEDSAVLTDTSFVDGGGAWLSGGTVLVTRARFAGDHAGGNGGGLLVTDSPGDITGSTFESNDAQNGGGVWWDGATRFMTNTVNDNAAVWLGGGIYVDTGSGEIASNVVSANSSGGDGAGGYTRYSTAEISENLFEANVSLDDAGGLRVFHGNATLSGDRFLANEAHSDGGGMKVSHAANVISGCVFEENVTDGNGGGLEIDDDISSVEGSLFVGNVANDGGGLHVLEPYYDVAVSGSTFQGNEARSCGGGVAMGAQGSIEDAYTLSLSRIFVDANRANSGGGLCARYGVLAVENAIVSGNIASNRGGGAMIDGVGGTFTNVDIYENDAPTGGGVMFSQATVASLADSIVSGNSGAGVWASGLVPVALYDDVWGNGTAYQGMIDPTGSNGNLAADPTFRDPASIDFQLAAGSPGIDAGEPTRFDADGTRLDLGAYGGIGIW